MNVLVLCTGNSARSILAEVLINALGEGRFLGSSAGSRPVGRVNPAAIATLERKGHATGDLASKSWDQFAGPGAPEIDLVITVCDNAAGETCPVWPGSPVRVHWGISDPAGAADETAAFEAAYTKLNRRVEALVSLPLESMDPESAREALQSVHALALAIEDDA